MNKLNYKIHSKTFLTLYLIFFLSGLYVILNYSKSDIHIIVNEHHSIFFDKFFKIITNFGDGWFVVIIALLLLLYKIRYSLALLVTFIASGIIAQIIKHIVDTPRPILYFKDVYNFIFGGWYKNIVSS